MQYDETGIYQSHSHYERDRSARHYFYGVITAYRDVLATPALVAISHDPEFPNRKLSTQMIEFKADVDKANEAALNDPSLIADWNRLVVQEEKVPNANDLIRKCAIQYRKRNLIPHRYFVTVKKGRPGRRQPVAPPQEGAA